MNIQENLEIIKNLLLTTKTGFLLVPEFNVANFQVLGYQLHWYKVSVKTKKNINL